MQAYAIDDSAVVPETVDDGRAVTVRRARWTWPRSEAGPSLVAEYVGPAEGPTRGTVVLVHGLAQNRYTWRVQARSIPAALAEHGFASVNLELRGHGLSRQAGAGNARSFSEYVDDVARVAASIDGPVVLMGHSLGAAACVGAATQVPVAGVIHIAGVYAFATYNPTLRAIARVSERLRPVFTQASVRVSTGWAGDLIGRLYSLTEVAGYGLPLAGWVPGSLERPVLEERLREGFDWTSLEVWLELCSWARGGPFPYDAAFRQIDVPVLVLSGDADPLARPVDAAPLIDAAKSDDVTHIVLEPFEYQCHWGHVDILLGRRAPAVVWPLVTSWLKERL